MGLPFAHIGGIPMEETIGGYGPLLLAIALAALARISVGLRYLRDHRRARATRR
jgi:hypothetical protein